MKPVWKGAGPFSVQGLMVQGSMVQGFKIVRRGELIPRCAFQR